MYKTDNYATSKNTAGGKSLGYANASPSAAAYSGTGTPTKNGPYEMTSTGTDYMALFAMSAGATYGMMLAQYGMTPQGAFGASYGGMPGMGMPGKGGYDGKACNCPHCPTHSKGMGGMNSVNNAYQKPGGLEQRMGGKAAYRA
jgi:hypothetical protein